MPHQAGRKRKIPFRPAEDSVFFVSLFAGSGKNIVEFVNEIRYEKLFRRTRLHGAVPARGLCLRHARTRPQRDGDPLPGNPGAKSYKNPVFREFLVADPTVIRAEDGNFYLYATESGRTTSHPALVRLVNWTKVG